MSFYSFTFLFDYSGFKEKISPALDALVIGNSDELQQMAVDLTKENPKIWDFVGYSRVPLYDDDLEKGLDDVVNAGVLHWLLLVIFNYCSNFSRDNHFADSEILRQVGIDDVIIDMLKNPKPLGDLLINISPKIIPTSYMDGNFNINKCPLYWLSVDEVGKIKTAIQTNVKQTNVKQTNTHSLDGLLAMLNNAVDSNKTLLTGFWFN
ncbi:MAG: hypothetical protein U0Z26_08160 [Anaerolineales bacterium]